MFITLHTFIYLLSLQALIAEKAVANKISYHHQPTNSFDATDANFHVPPRHIFHIA